MGRWHAERGRELHGVVLWGGRVGVWRMPAAAQQPRPQQVHICCTREQADKQTASTAESELCVPCTTALYGLVRPWVLYFPCPVRCDPVTDPLIFVNAPRRACGTPPTASR